MDLRTCLRPPARGGTNPAALLLAAAALALSACGGGGGPAADAGGPSTGASDAVPPALVFSAPRNAYRDNRLAFTWAPEAFGGSIFARIEFGTSFAEGNGWTLQEGGDAAVFVEGAESRFTLAYRDGFFLMTSQNDSTNDIAEGYGIDVYPGDVVPVSPAYQCGYDSPCANNIAFFPWYDFPRTAGETLSLAIPRDDPADLRYAVMARLAAGEGFVPLAENVAGLTATVSRGISWQYDFPTATARVSGCTSDGTCSVSEEQPLEGALLGGVQRSEPAGSLPTAAFAMSGNGGTLFTFGSLRPGDPTADTVTESYRSENRRWQPINVIRVGTIGVRRGLVTTHEGHSVAVEFGDCGDTAAICAQSLVVVFGRVSGEWRETGRFPGLARPRFSRDGTRLAGIRDGAAFVFQRADAGWQEQAVPATGAPARDLAFSGDGATVAIAHGGTADAPCACREVTVHVADAAGWRQTGRLAAAAPGGPEGSATDDGFGAGTAGAESLALNDDGTVLAVGAPGDTHATGLEDAGAAYLYRTTVPGGAWQIETVLRARGAAAGDRLGQRVALSADGKRLVAGARGLSAHAPGLRRNHAADAPLPAALPDGTPAGGAAYVFTYGIDCVWAHRAAILAPTSGAADFDRYFALATDAEGATVVLSTGSATGEAAAVLTY